MPLVLDASVTIAWAVADEATSPACKEIARRVADEGAGVPGLWRLEVGNGLLIAERRDRISFAQVEGVCRDLGALPIETDGETLAHAWSRSATLARKHGLTPYDAAYL